jgi:hypothetical protein
MPTYSKSSAVPTFVSQNGTCMAVAPGPGPPTDSGVVVADCDPKVYPGTKAKQWVVNKGQLEWEFTAGYCMGSFPIDQGMIGLLPCSQNNGSQTFAPIPYGTSGQYFLQDSTNRCISNVATAACEPDIAGLNFDKSKFKVAHTMGKGDDDCFKTSDSHVLTGTVTRASGGVVTAHNSDGDMPDYHITFKANPTQDTEWDVTFAYTCNGEAYSHAGGATCNGGSSVCKELIVSDKNAPELGAGSGALAQLLPVPVPSQQF